MAQGGVLYRGAGSVAQTPAPASGKTQIGAGTSGIADSSLTATVVNSTAGTLGTATPGTDYTALAFKTIAVSGQSDIVADTAADTLTVAAGSNITLTTNAGTDTLTIAASGSGNVSTSATLTAGKTIIGAGTTAVDVSTLTATVVGSSSGTLAAATAGTDYTALAFKTIAVSGQSDVVADSAADTLTLAAGSNITITTNAGTDTVTIAAAAPGTGTVTNTGTLTATKLIQGNGGVDVTVNATTATVTKLTAGVPSAATAGTDYTDAAFKTIAVSGQSDVVADSAADTLTLAAGTNITITTNAGTDTVTIAASGGGSGSVTNTGTLTDHAVIVGNGGVDVSALALATDTNQVLHGGVSADPTWEMPATPIVLAVDSTVATGTGWVVPDSLTINSGVSLTIAAGAIVQTNGGANGSKFGQFVSTVTSAVGSGSTQIPADDTIPQITEGDEYLTRSITPKSTTSTLLIQAGLMVSSDTASRRICAALFQDAIANALAVGLMQAPANTTNSPATLTFSHTMTAGTTASTTFRVRAGLNNSGTLTVNGVSAASQYGAVTKSFLTITEYLA